MQNILFFDTDALLRAYAAAHPLPDVNPIFFDESINAVSASDIEPYLNTEIISVFTHSETIPTTTLDKFPNLKLITTRTTGFNHIDLAYCKSRGIAVTNVPRYGEATVAEFAFGLLLALSRHIIQGRNGMAHAHVELEKYMGFDLMGKTVGVIGTGSIGRHFIKIAQGFGMNVLAYDLYPNPTLNDLYVDSLDTIYEKADIISLHVPSTPENYHLINETAFDKMKEGVMLINTARGDLIDTQALYAALRDGKVGGAGLDVLENEDFVISDEAMTAAGARAKGTEFLLDSAMNLKLLQFKNVIATPHIAFNSIDAINRINATTFETIVAFQNGTLLNSVMKA